MLLSLSVLLKETWIKWMQQPLGYMFQQPGSHSTNINQFSSTMLDPGDTAENKGYVVCLYSQSFESRILDRSTCVTSLTAVLSVYVRFLTELGWRQSQRSTSEVLISHRALLVSFWLPAIPLPVRITWDSMEGWAGKQIQNIDLCRSPLLQHLSPC